MVLASRSGHQRGLWTWCQRQPLGLGDCDPPPRVPLLRLWPLVVPIPVRPAVTAAVANQERVPVTCTGTGDSESAPAPGHRTGRVRVVGVILAPVAWGRQARLLPLHPLTATPPITGSQVLLVSSVTAKQSGEQTATPLKPPTTPRGASKALSGAYFPSPAHAL